ncbi:MAG: alkanesulfonate monooxygenase SsuD [Gammaproteobacteria bacterium]|jgi:alkanesulfonate monooxygenase SsuD/methylene tetrahydromethanopterin reductase-like flavin-dependent oxidoreductase (luciferase family)
MHVGYAPLFQNPENERSDLEVYQNELRLAELAEPLGFDSVWSVEHHFTDYTMCPDVTQFLSYMAAKTESIGLGSMVVVLPWHDPVRVAEQISMLDNMSNGRMILGIGRGLGRVEFDGFRVDMGESRTRFVESAQMVLQGLETGFVEADGEFIKQPKREIRPRPFKSFKGRSFAAAVSPESMPIMAKLGVGLLVIPQKPWEEVQRDFEVYNRVFLEQNAAPPPAPLCGGFYFVDESADRAEEMARKYIGRYYHTVMKHYEFTAGHLKNTKGYEYYAAIDKYIDKRTGDGAAEDFVRLMPFGTPAQVLEKLEHVHGIIGNQACMAHFSYAGMPYDEAERNMRLFAEKVLPEVKSMTMTTPKLTVSKAP